jgi:hypothetical protein
MLTHGLHESREDPQLANRSFEFILVEVIRLLLDLHTKHTRTHVLECSQAVGKCVSKRTK